MPFDLMPEVKVDPRVALIDMGIDRLERFGWCQGCLEDDVGRSCVMGAFGDRWGAVAGLVLRVLWLRAGCMWPRTPTVPMWNDSLSPETGRAEVVALLREVRSEL
jgi:hypothetical protein